MLLKNVVRIFITIILWIVLFLTPSVSQSRIYEVSHGMEFDLNAYIGWKQIFSNKDFDSVPSEPELGVTTSFKITDRLNVFNQFRYGTNINSILVYNQVNYTPYIPINYLTLTLKGGKLWNDWGLYGKTRVNPRTRIGVFQPQAIYWNILDQTITSGVGFGFELKYKDFILSYAATKPTTNDRRKMAMSWVSPDSTNYRADFGAQHIVSMDFELPKYGLRSHAFWSYFQFRFDSLLDNRYSVYVSPQNAGLGIEWKKNSFMASIEGMCTKRPGYSWDNFSQMYCGISPTISYDITPNFTIQANYNQYRTPVSSKIPNQTFTKDINLGLNWHSGSWIANVEAHYIRGGRLVDQDNFLSNPQGYGEFWVIGTNLVYFWN